MSDFDAEKDFRPANTSNADPRRSNPQTGIDAQAVKTHSTERRLDESIPAPIRRHQKRPAEPNPPMVGRGQSISAEPETDDARRASYFASLSGSAHDVSLKFNSAESARVALVPECVRWNPRLIHADPTYPTTVSQRAVYCRYLLAATFDMSEAFDNERANRALRAKLAKAPEVAKLEARVWQLVEKCAQMHAAGAPLRMTRPAVEMREVVRKYAGNYAQSIDAIRNILLKDKVHVCHMMSDMYASLEMILSDPEYRGQKVARKPQNQGDSTSKATLNNAGSNGIRAHISQVPSRQLAGRKRALEDADKENLRANIAHKRLRETSSVLASQPQRINAPHVGRTTQPAHAPNQPTMSQQRAKMRVYRDDNSSTAAPAYAQGTGIQHGDNGGVGFDDGAQQRMSPSSYSSRSTGYGHQTRPHAYQNGNLAANRPIQGTNQPTGFNPTVSGQHPAQQHGYAYSRYAPQAGQPGGNIQTRP